MNENMGYDTVEERDMDFDLYNDDDYQDDDYDIPEDDYKWCEYD